MSPLLPLLALALTQQSPADEARYYTVDHLVPPDGEVLEIGGLGFLSDGRLVCSTRRGQVWIVADPLAADPADARFSLFADGLWEGLGLAVRNDVIHVVQRGELSRLVDADEDGTCDDVVTLTDGWGLSSNYHEFAYGLPVDRFGNFYVTLNVGFQSPKWWLGASPVPWRGWTLRISEKGHIQPFACGFRSPCGVSLSPAGELFVTDNQGDWMPASPIFHVTEGGFYGHPASLRWTAEYLASETLPSDTVPSARAASDRRPAAVWLPYKWSRSPGNMAWDTTAGSFGPFADQFFLAELTNGMVLRGDFQRVRTPDDFNGMLQGWVVPFRRRVGSVVRVAFAPDDGSGRATLFGGLTNRGWGGLPPADGIARLRWTGETPFEVRNVELVPVDGTNGDATYGFRIELTRAPGALDGFAPTVVHYDYDYWWEYGSPERDTQPLAAAVASAEGSTLTLRIPGLEAGRVARMRLDGLVDADGVPLLHPELAYTVNQLPGTARATAHVAKIVPPPPARETDEEGWLRLSYGDATDRWIFEGWELCNAELDPDDPTRFLVTKGVNALTNTASPTPTNYVSKQVFGDAQVHVEFLLPEQGRSGVLLQGRYELVLSDGEDCGAVRALASGGPAVPPLSHAYRGPGLLHELDLEFRAPRFDAAGNKVANAVLVRAKLDDVLLHENVPLPEPTLGAELAAEAPAGPLVLRGDTGPVSIGNLRVRPLRGEGEMPVEAVWVPLFDGESLAGWTVNEEGLWYVEDGVLIGEGPRSHLFTKRTDFRDVEVRARVKISDGGNSGLYVRATPVASGWPKGYEAQINSSFADRQKTGSLYDLAPVTTHLIPPDTWFDYRVECREVEYGTRVRIWVNEVLITEFVDGERRQREGAIALQQHHDGSVVEVERVEVREL